MAVEYFIFTEIYYIFCVKVVLQPCYIQMENLQKQKQKCRDEIRFALS